MNATGTRVADEDEVHVWRFDTDGKVTHFKHGVDTQRHQVAISG